MFKIIRLMNSHVLCMSPSRLKDITQAESESPERKINTTKYSLETGELEVVCATQFPRNGRTETYVERPGNRKQQSLGIFPIVPSVPLINSVSQRQGYYYFSKNAFISPIMIKRAYCQS